MRRLAAMCVVLLAIASSCSANKREAAPSGTTVSCGDAPISLFARPPRALGHSQPDEVARHDPSMLGDADGLRSAAVWRTYRNGDVLSYLGGEPPTLHVVAMKRVRGKWKYWSGGSGCTTYVVHAGRTTARWWPVAPVDANATSFEVFATDIGCASGASADKRVGQAQVHETSDTVVVTFTARPLRGFQACPGHQPTRRTVHLRAPLGPRALLDGAIYPPQPPQPF